MLMLKFIIVASLLEAIAAQKLCTIPTGAEFQRANYALVFSDQRRLFPVSVFDGNWYFKAGTQIPDATKLRIHCDKDTYGDAIHIVHISHCRNGAWSPALPDCKEHAKCGTFPYVRAFASERRRPGVSYNHGHVITYRCPRNERLDGINEVVCVDGSWTEVRFRCIRERPSERKCSPLRIQGAVVDDQVTAHSGQYPSGSIVKYECLPGKQLTGNNTVVCTDGRWSVVRFKCLEIIPVERTCPPLRIQGAVVVDQVTAHSGQYPSGSVVKYECLPGKQLTGNNTVVCIDGRWSVVQFKCLEVIPAQKLCTIPTGAEFQRANYALVFSDQRRLFPVSVFDGNWYFKAGAQIPDATKLRIHCDKDTYGDAIHIVHTSHCRNGAWSPALPDCKEHAKCGTFPYVRAFASERRRPGVSYNHGHVITYRCPRNERLDGINEVVCVDGSWTEVRFRCIRERPSERKCSPLRIQGAVVVDQVTAHSGQYPSGSIVKYECLPGKQLTGNDTVVCTDGEWSVVQFKCLEVIPERKCSPLRIQGAVAVDQVTDHSGQYPSGSIVKYECLPGKQLTGNNTVVCADGSWSVVQFKCLEVNRVKRKCSPLRIQGAVVVDQVTDHSGQYPSGSFVKYECLPGKQLTGNNAVVCIDGRWSVVQFKCLEVIPERKCSPLRIQGAVVVDQVTAHSGQYPSGSIVKYECLPGKQLTGNNTVVCTDGRWSVVQFKCLEVIPVERTCPPMRIRGAVVVDQVTAHSGQYPSGSIVKYECLPGKQLTGNNTVVCTDGRWSVVQFKCLEVIPERKCSPLRVQGAVVVDQVTAHSGQYPSGSIVKYECLPGKQLTGNDTVVCTDGRWSVVQFKCLEVIPEQRGCRPLDVAGAIPTENSANDGNLIPSGTSLRFECEPGRVLSGNSAVVCHDGRWSEVKFTCDRKVVSIKGSRKCRGIRIQGARADRHRRKFKHRSVVKYTCLSGRRLVGDDKLVCTNGRWSEIKFSCQPVRQRVPATPHLPEDQMKELCKAYYNALT